MKHIFDQLSKLDLSPNAFYLLWCIANGTKSMLSSANNHTELRVLVNKGYLNADYSISNSGYDVFKAFSDQEPLVTTVISSDHSVNIDKYISIFPKGKLPSGKPARVNKKNIEDAFKWFHKTYEYDWDTILRATLYYVDTYEKTNYMYMKNSQYFIRKQSTDKSWDSELANYCEIIINGEDEDDAPHFKENVI